MTDLTSLEQERTFLLESLQRLEGEYADGSITKDEYNELRDQQTVRAAAVLRKIESVSKPEIVAIDRRPKPKNRVVLAATAAFVMLAIGGLLAATDSRQMGESSTGDIAADSNTLLERARNETGRGRADLAVRTYDEVLTLNPNNPEALAYRGWLIRLAGLPNEGLESINKAIAIDPTYPDARFFKGSILLRDRQQPAAAATEFEAFLANDPPQQLVPLVEQALADARAQAAG